jgi:RNA polymerase sigma-70 factor (ECF subfamily)
MSNPEREWPERLASESSDREAALGELRVFLLKGVRSGLSGRARADEYFIEDVVQMALVHILDSLDRFEGRSAFKTWALAIALRVAYSELRRKDWNNVSLEELREKGAFLLEEVDTSVNPLEAAAFKSLITLMHQLVRTKLTERQRTVMLAELNEMPHEEIAAQLNIPRNAVYKLSHDARKALRRALEAAGYELEQVRDVLESPTR